MATVMITVSDLSIAEDTFKVDFNATGEELGQGHATAAYFVGYYLHSLVNTPEFTTGVADYGRELIAAMNEKGCFPAPFDPATVMTKHGPYQGVSGWFAISTDAPTKHDFTPSSDAVGLGGRDAAAMPTDQTPAANTLCGLGRSHGIPCSVVPTTGRHDWPLATQVFTAALPWLAGAIHTPGVTPVPLPAGSPIPGH